MKKLFTFFTSLRVVLSVMLIFSCFGLSANTAEINKTREYEVSVVSQQEKTIEGVVTDNLGPAVGVSVKVKGTVNGTITDLDGKFTLKGVPEDAILQISFIGFVTQELTVGSQTFFDVKLEEQAQVLDEVIVVGYGTQKKVNLTGAIGQIDSKALEARPITSTSSALQGAIPNLQVTNLSGEPGKSSSLNIRGTTSISGGGPLVLVDGVEMSMDLVNPNDIANVTVLKDAAAAAIYGVRAAFGVILVTTKTGATSNKTTVSYSGNFSFAKPSIMPEFVGTSWEFAEWMNEACVNGKQTAGITRLDVIEKMKAYDRDPRNNPEYEITDGQLYYYGYSDLADMMIRSSAPTQRHNLNISGGNEKTKFYTSVGYLNQEGIYKVGDDKFQRLNTRLTVENQVTNWLRFGAKALYNYSTQDRPFVYDSKDVWKRVIYSLPTDFIQPWVKDERYPEKDRFDGMYMENNSYQMLKDGGRNKYNEHDIWLSASADLDIMKGWKAHVDFTYNINTENASEHSKPLKFFDKSFNETYGRTSTGYFKKYNYHKNYYSFNAYTEYENTFGKHYLKGMAGYNQELTRYTSSSGQRYDILKDDQPTLSQGTGNQVVSEGGYEWALRGAFFRLNYIYADRYLFEVNGRYDGTSRFPSADRFVFLPSFSAAWRMSEEAFMSSTRSWLDNLKFRVSYGKLGNQLISVYSASQNYYPYIPFLSNGTSGNWIFGDEKATIINPGNLVSPSLTWEKAATLNFGTDVTILNQRLDFSFDYYERTTSDMLLTIQYPEVLGANGPPTNGAELKTKGWELSLSWRDKIGKDFTYDVSLILSDSQAEITKYDNPSGNINTFYVGKKYGDIWGYTTEGLFQSAEDVANSPSQKAIKDTDWGPGDVKFKDLNGDEVISNGRQTLDDHGDLSVIGNTTPRYQYGININLGYKDFYLRALMQGVGQQEFFPSDESFWPAGTQYYNAQKWHMSDSWTPDNPNAYFPIVRAADSRNRVTQSRYLLDASYLRMKNLTIGWNLPKQWIKKAYLSNASIYVSGENLFEITNIKGPYDPESARETGKMVYPFMRTYSFGINLTF